MKKKKFIPTPSSTTVHYFAYGSNMYLKRLEKRVGPVVDHGHSHLPYYVLLFSSLNGSSGYATILQTPNPDSFVIGRLYTLTEDQLEQLDWYEGRDRSYNRAAVNVQQSGKIHNAITYVRCEGSTFHPPSITYKGYLTKGFEEMQCEDEKWLIDDADLLSTDYFQQPINRISTGEIVV